MRKIVYILLIMASLISCKALKLSDSQRLTIYYDPLSTGYSWVFPNYFIFRDTPKTFEFYFHVYREGVLGIWTQNGDTLFIYPQFIEQKTDSYSKITTSYWGERKRLLIVNDSLFDLDDWTLKPNYDFAVERLFDTIYTKYTKINIEYKLPK